VRYEVAIFFTVARMRCKTVTYMPCCMLCTSSNPSLDDLLTLAQWFSHSTFQTQLAPWTS